MKISKDTYKTKIAGQDRYRISARGEYRRGLVPHKKYLVDENKIPFRRKMDAQRFWDNIIAPRLAVGGIQAEGKTFYDAYCAWLENEMGRGRDGEKFESTAFLDGKLIENHVLNKMTLRGVPIGKVPLLSIDYALLRSELMKGGQLTSLTQMRTDKPLSRDTIKNILQWIKKIFDIAVNESWIPYNPAMLLKLSDHKKDPLKDAIDPKTYDKLADEIPQMFDALAIIEPSLVLPFKTLRWSGMRCSELRALSVSQLNATNQFGSIWVNQAWKNNNHKTNVIGPVKGPRGRERSRYVPIKLSEVQELLQHAMRHGARNDDLVFTSGTNKTPINDVAMRHHWYQAQFAIRGWGFFRSSNSRDTGRAYRLVKMDKPISQFTPEEWTTFAFGQAGLAKGKEREGLLFKTIEAAAEHANVKLFGLHDLRHLYASKLFTAGLQLREVADLLGDTEETTERYYLHYMKKTVDQHLAVLRARDAVDF